MYGACTNAVKQASQPSREEMPRSKRFDQKKGVRRLARERVGTVKPTKAIEPKSIRKKPKHKKKLAPDLENE